MGRDWIATDDEGEINVDYLSSQKWLEGHLTGAQAVVAYLRKESARIFAQGDDDAKAVFLRDVCGDIVRVVYGELGQAAVTHALTHPFRIGAVATPGTRGTTR